MQQNLGGALPGIGAMANYGAMRYTNAVFTEDEEGLPHGSERHGFTPGTNSVSLERSDRKNCNLNYDLISQDQYFALVRPGYGIHCKCRKPLEKCLLTGSEAGGERFRFPGDQ